MAWTRVFKGGPRDGATEPGDLADVIDHPGQGRYRLTVAETQGANPKLVYSWEAAGGEG